MQRTLKINFRFIAFCLVALIIPFYPIYAEEASQPPTTEVVFLLDASNSMNTNDPEFLALDSVKQMAYSLPSNYRTGFVAFNNGVTVSAPITEGAEWNRIEKLVDSVTYKGYTDAGNALQGAVDLLLASDSANKKLVLLSDGEIAMSNQGLTDESVEKYNAALETAVSHNIPLYMIALGPEMNDTTTNIYQSFQKHGGKVYSVQSADEIHDAVRKLLFDDFGIKKTSVGLSETVSSDNKIDVQIPVQFTDQAKILITANSTIENITANYNASNANIIRGKHFSVIEIDKPGRQDVNITLKIKEGSQIRADLMTEYTGILEGGMEYTDVTTDTQIERTANVWFGLRSPSNSDLLLLNDTYYNNKTIKVIINGVSKELPLLDGKVLFTYPVTKSEQLEIDADFTTLDTNLMLDKSTLKFALEPPPPLEIPEPDYRPLWVGLSVLGILLVSFIIWLLIQKKKHRPLPPEPIVSRYEFSGRLNFYITQTPDDSDIPPQTYNLYRIYSKAEITLAKILEDCGIKVLFEGADKISFVPGTNKSLVITNHSDCSILKGRELLIKRHSYPIYFDEKLYITFEDEKSEMELHYKNVKPSDRK